MKEVVKLFQADFNEFVRNNRNVLIICLLTVFAFQYLGKGNFLINLSVVALHVIGDVMMIISITKYSQGEKKSSVVYLILAAVFFVPVGLIAVLQSDNGKNWQYFLGTFPFLIATLYQYLDAWDKKGKELFNYKTTILTTIVLAIIYYKMDLVYNHAWPHIIGFSLFPIFLAMQDSPRIFLAKMFSIVVMLFGVLVDIIVQFSTPGVIPAPALSSFFITLIAFFGFSSSAHVYIKKVDSSDTITRYALNALIAIKRAT